MPGGQALELDARELRLAGAAMVALGAVLPLLPGEPGFPCPLRTLTGIPCPLCGMTTSVEATVRLDLAGALAANPAGIAAVAVVLALLVVRPNSVRLWQPLVYVCLALMWLYELRRFSIL